MKLRIKLFMITMLAMLAFVGIGFASWTFTNEVKTSDVAVSDKVAVAVEMDETFGLKAYADAGHTIPVTALYLICDAPTEPSTGAKYLAGSGVYWAYEADGAHPITNLYLQGQLNYDANDNVKTISSVTVGFTLGEFSVTNAYVTFGSLATPADVIVSVADEAKVEATLVLPTVEYSAAALALENVAGVDTMDSSLAESLSGKKIVVSAKIKSVA